MSDWIWFIYVTALDSKFPGCLSFFFFVAVFSPDHYQGSWGALHHSHTHTWLEGLHTGEVTGYNINNSTQLPKDSKKPTYHRASLTNTDNMMPILHQQGTVHPRAVENKKLIQPGRHQERTIWRLPQGNILLPKNVLFLTWNESLCSNSTNGWE